jgi:hypothetical protein
VLAREPDAGAQAGAEVLSSSGQPDGAGTEDDPVDVQGDLDRAVQLLTEGKHVRLNQPDEVSTLVGKLGKLVNDARAAGRTPPKINLCDVTVAGTNLFCVGNKGLTRLQMPQLEGSPAPGSPADKLPRNAKGFVEASAAFRDALKRFGVTVTTGTRPANHLRPTQTELDGATVARIADEIENAGRHDAPIYVTRDGYIIDGHHMWAAQVVVDAKDNRLGDVQTDVHEVDMDIGAALDFARRFTQGLGINPQDTPLPADGP